MASPKVTPSSELSNASTSNPLKILYFGNEFPPDDLKDLCRRLLNFSKDKAHAHLALFFDHATAAVKAEIQDIPPFLQALLPPFESVLTLANHPDLRKGPLTGAIEGVLLILVEIASLIGHYEEHNTHYELDRSISISTGLGIGLLAASAVAIAPTLADVAFIGAEAIRNAFRVGLVVDSISQDLEQRDPEKSPDSWAYVVANQTEEVVQAELDAWNKREKCAEPSKIFISVAGSSSVTVSGPPSKLKTLFKTSNLLRHSRFVSLPIYGGLCHAPHIYTRDHARQIVSTEALTQIKEKLSPGIPVLSTSTGGKYDSISAADLFENVVFELLTGTIRWNNVLDSLDTYAAAHGWPEIQIMTFRKTVIVNEMMATLSSSAANTKLDVLDLVSWIFTPLQDGTRTRVPRQSKIAIVGMSCRLPGGADDTRLFWELLEQGKDVHRKVPADRFDVDTHTDPTGKRINTSLTPFGCFINQPGLFDAGFFNISPREALETDPMHRLALVTAYEALEQAGFVANRTPSSHVGRTGTFYGQASDDYREVNSGQNVDTYFITGGCRAFAPGRINYFFKFSGPSFSCDTACSSSLATIQIACTSLWAGDADTVVAGGLNVLTNSDAFAGLSRGHFLSKTGSCKTWDIDADGYCRGDGICSIVLKRLEDAEADNDNILGIVAAAATNHSANAISIMHPHAGHQSDLFRQVLDRAGVSPFDVSYAEMHGTGTQAGDIYEMKSITDVFAPISPTRSSPLHVGAAKANIGHGEAVAGITALIKVLLMLENEAIPPHVGIKTAINPVLPKDLDRRGVKIPFSRTAWPRILGMTRRAFVNNFSAAGGNTSLLIEEAPVRGCKSADPRPSFVVAVSAKSKLSFALNLERMISYLDANPLVSLADLSYTTCARRVHHNHRIAVMGLSIADVKTQLGQHVPPARTHRPVPPAKPMVGFAFTGQGAFYSGIGRELYQEQPAFQSEIHRLNGLVETHGFPSILPAIVGDVPKDHEFLPIIAQLTIVCSEIALARFWALLGVTPSVVVGCSLGEYAALVVAGVLSASDAIFLAGTRAIYLSEACQVGTHAMMAVQTTEDQIKETLRDQPYSIACYNAPSDICISGPQEQITAARPLLEEAGHKCHQLTIPYAFHSSQMDPILEKFEAIAKSATYKAPKLPVLSPLLGEAVFDAKTINGVYMAQATRRPVRLPAALLEGQAMALINDKTVWIDVGPHPVCASFLKSTLSAATVAVESLRRDENNWITLARSMATLHSVGVTLNWMELYKPFESSLKLLGNLPAYAWDEKNYWMQYNGDWMLVKDKTPVSLANGEPVAIHSKLITSGIHYVLEEDISESRGRVVIRSNVLHPDFLKAVNGHRMNNCDVVTSSIHAEIAFTLAEYVYKQVRPETSTVDMNITQLVVLQGLIARKDRSKPQWIQVTADADYDAGTTRLFWHNVQDDGNVEDHFASATVVCGNSDSWLSEWERRAHFVIGRIDALEQMAREGSASRLNRTLAYKLFGNLVDYAEHYRGMQSVVLNGLEACADVVLDEKPHGTWTIPPHHVDSVAHLAGFICNGGDALDPKNNFYVTSGWDGMRFAKALVPGSKYRSYVKMFAMKEPNSWSGDVSVLQGDTIIGLCEGIKFHAYPRILLSSLFSPPDVKAVAKASSKPSALSSSAAPLPSKVASPKAMIAVTSQPAKPKSAPGPLPPLPAQPQAVPYTTGDDESETASQAIALIAEETGIDASQITASTQFTAIGVDSLLSLVLAEKFREKLGLEIKSSLFLEYPSVGDLRAWIEKYC